MANAQAQAVKIILIAELRDDVAQPVMPAVPAAEYSGDGNMTRCVPRLPMACTCTNMPTSVLPCV